MVGFHLTRAKYLEETLKLKIKRSHYRHQLAIQKLIEKKKTEMEEDGGLLHDHSTAGGRFSLFFHRYILVLIKFK